MPRHTQHCTACDWTDTIQVDPYQHPPCPVCASATERLWSGHSASVTQDEWPGGKVFENLGDTPVTVYSRSELRRELQARGLEPCVRHVPIPGTDKSPYTTNWDVPSERTLANAKALLERVGTVPVRAPRERTGVGPFATPELVKQVNDAWH